LTPEYNKKWGDRIMPATTYDQVISEIKALNLSDQLRLLEETATLIRKRTSKPTLRSILELKGKGKDIWKGLNVRAYIDEERSSWNG
jgi:uncharacterized protein (DUF488 family)